MAERRVVISGLGAVSPLGNDRRNSWQKVIKGESGIARVTLVDPTPYPSQIAGEVKNFNADTLLPLKEQKRLDRYSLFALAAAKEAWTDAGLDGHSDDPTRMGCIMGVGIGGLKTLEDNHRDLLEVGFKRISPFLIPKMISNLGPGNVAMRFNLQGVNYTVTSACTSGTHAMGEAYRMIKDGLQDVMITGGAEAGVTDLGLAGFGRMTALSTRNEDPEHASRPFDRDRDGFVIGEGAGILVFEEYERAKKRGANIYAEVVGYGFSCDAFHITAPCEDGRGAVQCMNMALQSAQKRPEQIQYINAHGTSTPVNDPIESLATEKVFGDHARRKLVISSTKSVTGHLLGAAGGLEGVFLAMVIKDSTVPPTMNFENPGEGCNLDYCPNEARELSVELAMSNSFGFGGTNASIVFARV